MPSRQHGFTLVELLIVVAVIALLAAIAVPNYLNAQIKAGISKVLADHKALETAIETYRLDHPEQYVPGYVRRSGKQLYNFERHFFPLTTPIDYLQGIPSDPFPHHSGRELDKTVDYKQVVPGAHAYGYFRADIAGPGGLYDFGRHKWMVSSAGPDGMLNYFAYYPEDITEGEEFCAVCNIDSPAIFMVAVQYQPSNGLNSSGEIIRWSPTF